MHEPLQDKSCRIFQIKTIKNSGVVSRAGAPMSVTIPVLVAPLTRVFRPSAFQSLGTGQMGRVESTILGSKKRPLCGQSRRVGFETGHGVN